jgi:signal transduction histidine kinase
MTLRRQMAYQIAAMIVGLLLLAGASLWGLNGLHQDFDAAIEGYQRLRQVYEISSHVATARTLVTLSRPDEGRALAELQTAMDQLDLFAGGGSAAAVRSGLGNAIEKLKLGMADHPAHNPAGLVEPLNRVLVQAANLAAQFRRMIEYKQNDADRKRQTTMILMAILSGTVVLGAVLVGVAQYRSVMNPLHRLGEGVRTIAAGQFANRIAPQGHAEFAALAEDFNRMAAELDGLYRELEQKVAAKSKELVRSERLASVGYLAAGVAHEINNPIGIIAAHAEFALQQLRRNPGPQAAADVEKTLRVVCDEAFRCKEIVAQLLSLARPGEENRRIVSLGAIAANVVSIVSGLGQFRDRQLTLHAGDSENLNVLASEGEMKQVVLNLTLNALEAIGSDGQVHIDVGRRDGFIELSVSDNGRGMSGDVLERVFEPFFTAKRGSAHPGTGLGLSITHAIVESHGGQIAAYSEGIGKGSRFVVRLPPSERGETA